MSALFLRKLPETNKSGKTNFQDTIHKILPKAPQKCAFLKKNEFSQNPLIVESSGNNRNNLINESPCNLQMSHFEITNSLESLTMTYIGIFRRPECVPKRFKTPRSLSFLSLFRLTIGPPKSQRKSEFMQENIIRNQTRKSNSTEPELQSICFPNSHR